MGHITFTPVTGEVTDEVAKEVGRLLRDVVEGVPAGTEAYADRKFLTVSVTVFHVFKNRKSFIHAGLRRLFHSTYQPAKLRAFCYLLIQKEPAKSKRYRGYM
jgi:hypothetical protein